MVGSSSPSSPMVLARSVELGPVRDGETPGCARPHGGGRCREGPQLRPLVFGSHCPNSVPERVHPFPWPGLLPRRRRARTAEDRRRYFVSTVMAVEQGPVCSRLREGSVPGSSTERPESIDSCTEAHQQRRLDLGHDAVPEVQHLGGSCARWLPSRVWDVREGESAPARDAFWARWSITTESLPPENSSTGRSNSRATSRMMWIDWASDWRAGHGQLVTAPSSLPPGPCPRKDNFTPSMIVL